MEWLRRWATSMLSFVISVLIWHSWEKARGKYEESRGQWNRQPALLPWIPRRSTMQTLLTASCILGLIPYEFAHHAKPPEHDQMRFPNLCVNTCLSPTMCNTAPTYLPQACLGLLKSYKEQTSLDTNKTAFWSSTSMSSRIFDPFSHFPSLFSSLSLVSDMESIP
jgi:hypothetical protein